MTMATIAINIMSMNYRLMTMARKVMTVICQQSEVILGTELQPSWLQWLLLVEYSISPMYF